MRRNACHGVPKYDPRHAEETYAMQAMNLSRHFFKTEQFWTIRFEWKRFNGIEKSS